MFQDALMESGGKLTTRSRYFSILAILINSLFLLALTLWPLIHPLALPKQALNILLIEPAPPSAAMPMVRAAVRAAASGVTRLLLAPSTIQTRPNEAADRASAPDDTGSNFQGIPGDGNNTSSIGTFLESTGTASRPVVREAPQKKIAISSGVMEGNRISGGAPAYPAIARAARIQGTVVMAATISKSGNIENLRVLSGQPMLISSAVEAVKLWRYRPYLLNGEPVEVETTINVVFNLGN